MSLLLGFANNWLQQLAASELLAECVGLLVLLAAAVILFRTFRESYVLFWIAGWFWFLIYRLLGEAGNLTRDSQLLAHVTFVLAVAFITAGIAEYTSVRRRILAIGVLALLAIGLAITRIQFWPDSRLIFFLVHTCYRVMTVGAALQLMTFNRGRRDTGPWLMIPPLLLMHLDESAIGAHAVPAMDLAIETLLGTSMVLVVLEEARARTRRLRTVRAITGAIARAQNSEPMMMTSLRELCRLVEARAGWFRLFEGDKLVLKHHLGVSPEFVKQSAVLETGTSFGRLVLQEGPAIIRAGEASHEPTRAALLRDGFDHVVLIPLKGKNSVLGTLGLGYTRRHCCRAEELGFLESTAKQIGIAMENLRMLEQVRLSQQQWASTFDSIQDLILVHDAENRIMQANQALLRRLGRNYADVINQGCESVLPNAGGFAHGCPYCGLPVLVEAADPCFGGFSLVSTSSYTEQGATRAGTIHIIRDTSESRAAEEKYRMLFDQVQEGVFISTPDGRLLDCNEGLVKMLRYDRREELLALNASELYVNPEQREAFRREMAAHNSVHNLELQLRCKDGSAITVIENSIATRDATGAVVKYQGFMLDVTEKKRVEDEIRRHNRELQTLNAIAVTATRSFDLDEILNVTLRHVVELFSADTGAMYVFEPENKQPRRRAAFGHRTTVPSVFDSPESMRDTVSIIQDSRIELLTHSNAPPMPLSVNRFIEAEGLRSWMAAVMWSKDTPLGFFVLSSRTPREFSATEQDLAIAIGRQLATTIEKVRLYEETCRAYDHLRRTQEQLLQSEKMSAVGQLISGVAHELNNPLTAILGYSQLLEAQPLDDRARDFVQKLFRQAQRTQRIVQNLLSFARQRKPMKAEVDLSRVLEDTLALREYDLNLSNIAVQREYEEGLPAVIADSHQIEQVFLNIINNAVDAIQEANRAGLLRVRVFAGDGYVCTEFWDSGHGLTDAKRVFDPFYTTKMVGKGTGLGLSICYGIIKEHGGDIVAHNHPGGGAVFQVRLPAAVRARKPEPPPPQRQSTPVLRGRVLIVDDEEPVLDFEREVLAGAGLEVEFARSGREAIARLKGQEFDAVVLDGKMPGAWNAIEIYRWIAQHRPGQEKKVLLAVSDAMEMATKTFLAETGTLSIMKPFEVAELISAMRRVLRQESAASAGGA